jgi:hypothetical protein
VNPVHILHKTKELDNALILTYTGNITRKKENERGREGGRAGREGKEERTYLVQVPNLLFQGGEKIECDQLGSFLGLFRRDVGADFARHELAVSVGGEVTGCVYERG